MPTATGLTNPLLCTSEGHNAVGRVRSNTVSKYSFAIVVPRLTSASCKGGHSKRYGPVDWDCTLSVRPWTPWSSRARGPRTGCDSASIWRGRAATAGEGEDTVQISARRHDSTTIFDVSGDIDFANSREVRQSVLREVREIRTSRVVVNL